MNFICVRNGDRYGPEYVYRLKRMIERHAPGMNNFTCLTDRPKELPELSSSEIADGSFLNLRSWWLKMAIFMFDHKQPSIYFDLDTVIIDDLSPLIRLAGEIPFGICKNFTRAAGNHFWPCNFGSCVMTFNSDLRHVWYEFDNTKDVRMARAGVFGDQFVIEELLPNAHLLQSFLPSRFLLGYRDFTERKPQGTSVAVFAGRHKPHNSKFGWVKQEWER